MLLVGLGADLGQVGVGLLAVAGVALVRPLAGLLLLGLLALGVAGATHGPDGSRVTRRGPEAGASDDPLGRPLPVGAQVLADPGHERLVVGDLVELLGAFVDQAHAERGQAVLAGRIQPRSAVEV